MSAILLLTLSLFNINGIEKCNYGYYMDVKPSVYNLYVNLEKMTNDYIQVDCNY